MYTEVNNQQIYYQKVGRGKDLIMLHGWGMDVSTFWPILDLLKDDFTLWLIDLPGFGRSEKPKKAFNSLDYADIVAEFINTQKLERPNLLGHSLGGKIAIRLASKKGGFINKLILVSSAGIKPKQTLAKSFYLILSKVFNLIPDFFNLKERLRLNFYKSRRLDYYFAHGMKDTLVNILEEDLSEELPKIKNKTLIIWGEKDIDTPLYMAKKMYRLIPDARLEISEDATHFVYLENMGKFSQLIKDFCL